MTSSGASRRPSERGTGRGERRRAALVRALEELLSSQSLGTISTGAIAKTAGVSRTAFYFYFPNKAAAVVVLFEGVCRELLDTWGMWRNEGRVPRAQLSSGFQRVGAYWRANARLLVAVFDAIGGDAGVRRCWGHWSDTLVKHVAAKIVAERKAGNAPWGPDAEAMAVALVGMNERAIEREVRSVVKGKKPSRLLADVLFQVWHRSIYGREG